MKSIDTLRDDMYAVVDGSLDLTDEQIDDEVQKFTETMGEQLRTFLTDTRGGRVQKSSIRLSRMGVPCTRKLWYEEQRTVPDEPLAPSTRIKFFFGHVLEAFLSSLVRLSGHDLSGEQDEINFASVKGHRDGLVDGHTVDFKSASTFSFVKQRDGKLLDDDPFGYLSQLWSYEFGRSDGQRRSPYIISIDKQHGHIAVTKYDPKVEPAELAHQIEEKVGLVTREEAPNRCFTPVADGKSGNLKLSTVCSYCDFKKRCWPETRTFLYSTGPRFLVNVAKEPNVPELKADGTVEREKF